jgi:phage tail sheath protein FI
MPVTPTFPGVYIEEVPSAVKTIVGVATSITAFVGRAVRGPTNDPTRIQNFGDFERTFGGVDASSTLSYAVQHFFLNGGSDAIIVRVANGESAAKANLDAGGLLLRAKGEGQWGNFLRVRVDYDTRDPDNPALFNLAIHDAATGATEEFRNLSVVPDDQRFVETVLREESVFVEPVAVPDARPAANDPLDPPTDDPFHDDKPGYYHPSAGDGVDGGNIRDEDMLGVLGDKTGIYALEKADLFNILCLPPLTRGEDVADSTYAAAASYCINRRALLLVDPPVAWNTVKEGEDGVNRLRAAIGKANSKNAAFFFPRLKMPDPKKENRLQDFAPCGSVAGVIARTDQSRGVWKSPAGLEASLVGVKEFTLKLTDPENGRLNPLGVNCLRSFPVHGNLVWGSRTLDGADRLSSEWKYLAVRRVTLFIEESLYRGTQWVVFEPNDEPLWAQIRLNVGAFMHNLFRQGAFQGRSPREAYFVKCGKDTTNQNDINLGIVNIEVGFAPLKPAEFVIIKIQQITGQIDT